MLELNVVTLLTTFLHGDQIVFCSKNSVPCSLKISDPYLILVFCRILDFICIMTYDMSGPWDNVTGHNAGLHRSSVDADKPKEDLFTVDVALQYWITAGNEYSLLLYKNKVKQAHSQQQA